jgi:divalent metal cation (Fe/Co/Zn/Cd) transporter
MRVIVDAGNDFVEAHRIAEEAERRVSQLVPGADVVIHADPAERGDGPERDGELSDLMEAHRGMFAGYHDLSIVHHRDGYLVSMHLEMDSSDQLEKVHKVCDHLERDIRERIPGSTVTIHVEPARKGRGRKGCGRKTPGSPD